MRNFTTTLIASLFFSFSAIAQSYVNKEWELQNGTPSNYDLVSSALDPSGNLVTTANTLIGSATQIHHACIPNVGGLAWQQNCTGSSTNNNYGVDIQTDPSGNVYTCGAYHNGSNYNYIVSKYTASGTMVWQQFYNGPGNNDDVPSALKLDNSGNVYVTGSSYGLGTFSDFATIKYNNSGVLQWVKRYDFSNKPEIATGLLIDISGNIYITGASASSPLNSDITTIKYNSAGTVLNIYRYSYAGNGYDIPADLSFDNSGNVVITGSFDNGSKKFGTLKLTSALALAWMNTITGSGVSEGYGISADNSGNIISVGYQNNSSGASDIVINKYASSGSLIWQKKMSNPNPSYFAKARRVKTDPSGNIYIIADAQINTTKDFLTLALDAIGNTKWAQYFNSPTNGNDVPNAIQIKNNEIFVSGISTNGFVKQVSTVKYSVLQKNQPIVYVSGKEDHLANDILVRFQPSSIISSKINNKDLKKGVVADFVTPIAIDSINLALGYDIRKFSCYKVFPNHTTADTLSITRTGRTIKILPFYATLGIIFPEGTNDTLTAQIIRSKYKETQSAELNYLYQLHTANDPEYTSGNSAGLDPTGTIPNANINISPAWNVETGQSNIIVGVFDSGINWAHQEFGSGTLAGSKISAGYDYYNNIPYSSVAPTDLFGHGTACAGIIGAFRNNNFGVAGVAGGDATLGNSGVTLNDMKIFEGNTASCFPSSYSATLAMTQQAMVDGAISNPATGIGLAQNVQNHSWGGGDNQMIKDATRTVFENEVVMSISSGNNENAAFTASAINYPSSYKDEWAFKVGANDATGGRASFSNGLTNLDFIAPGTRDLYTSLDKTASNFTDILTWGPGGGCSGFVDGTSFSAPHVAGVAALIISHINNHPLKPNNVAPEDIEKILERFATDLTATPYSPGYDTRTGWGRIDAGQAVINTQLPNYELKHYSFSAPVSSSVLVGLHEVLWIPAGNPWGLPTGTTFINRYEVTATNSHSITGYTLIDAWKRDAPSNLLNTVSIPGGTINPLVNVIPNEINVALASFSSTSATLKGYTYEILSYDGSTGTFTSTGIWYPLDLTQTASFAYTLYLKNNSIGINENENESNISVYPNPATNDFTLTVNLQSNEEIKIEIYDVAGKLLKSFDKQKFTIGVNSFKIDATEFPNGIYLIKVKNVSYSLNKTLKFLINK